MEDLDRKFTFVATKVKDCTNVTQEEAIIFLAKDNLVLPMLKYYLNMCLRNPVSDAQIKGVKLLIGRVEKWRHEHPSECKFPDIAEGVEDNFVNADNE